MWKFYYGLKINSRINVFPRLIDELINFIKLSSSEDFSLQNLHSHIALNLGRLTSAVNMYTADSRLSSGRETEASYYKRIQVDYSN